MVSPIYEFRHSGGFVVSEDRDYRSRDVGTYTNATGSDILLIAGTVLATAAGADAVVAPGTNTGTGTLGSLTYGGAVIVGTYTLKATSATNFTVTNPLGESMPAATVGTPYSNAELNFTLTAGGTAFVANDSFTIALSPADARYINWVNANPAVALSYNTVRIKAGTTQRITVLSRSAEINGAELIYDPAITGSVSPTPSALAVLAAQQLKAVGIITR